MDPVLGSMLLFVDTLNCGVLRNDQQKVVLTHGKFAGHWLISPYASILGSLSSRPAEQSAGLSKVMKCVVTDQAVYSMDNCSYNMKYMVIESSLRQ